MTVGEELPRESTQGRSRATCAAWTAPERTRLDIPRAPERPQPDALRCSIVAMDRRIKTEQAGTKGSARKSGFWGTRWQAKWFSRKARRRQDMLADERREQGSSVPRKYVIRYFFDYGCSFPLWAENDAARRDLGLEIDPEKVGLSVELHRRIGHLRTWFDSSVNWKTPPDPGPWRQDECDRFNAEAAELLELIRRELGVEYEVIDRFVPLYEDPDLDLYLADPKNFRPPPGSEESV
jgi:hypothetical protein